MNETKHGVVHGKKLVLDETRSELFRAALSIDHGQVIGDAFPTDITDEYDVGKTLGTNKKTGAKEGINGSVLMGLHHSVMMVRILKE